MICSQDFIQTKNFNHISSEKKHLQPQIGFSIMTENQLKRVHYLVKHEVIK